MPAIAMSPILSPKEVFENYGLKPNHLARRRERFCTDKATSKIG